MGDPRRQHKKYSRPKQLFAKDRIEEEKLLIKKYGLKNRREIWIAESYINRIRTQAKKLIVHPEQQEVFINRLARLGLVKPTATIDDILALNKEKLLERRLQTIVYKKGLAQTPKAARQLIVHKKVKIGDRIINIPSYIVKVDEENKINLLKRDKEKIDVKEAQEQEALQ